MNQYESRSLVKIESVNQKSDTDFYLGKRCAPPPPPAPSAPAGCVPAPPPRAAAAAAAAAPRADLAPPPPPPRVCYIYKAKTEKNGSKFRVIWGKVCKAHGNNGVVRCKFAKNLPPSSISGPCRIMLYPSRI